MHGSVDATPSSHSLRTGKATRASLLRSTTPAVSPVPRLSPSSPCPRLSARQERWGMSGNVQCSVLKKAKTTMDIKELLTSALKHSLVFIGSVGALPNIESSNKRECNDYLQSIEDGSVSDTELVSIADELVKMLGRFRDAERFTNSISNHRQLARELRELVEQTDGCVRNRGNTDYLLLYAIISLKR